MTSITRLSILLVPAVLMGLMTPLVFSTESPQQAAPSIATQVSVDQQNELTDDERLGVSSAAARLLKHVNQARRAIVRNERVEVSRHLEQAQLLGRIVERVMPEIVVKAKITAGDLEYTDEEKVKPLVVPVYDELEKVSILGPVVQAKRDAEDRTEEQTSTAPLTLDVKLRHTKVKLDVALAMPLLEQAKKAIADGDTDAAGASLAAIQTGVIFEYAISDLPLERARINLAEAQGLIAQGKHREARFALKVASDSLQRYANGVGDQQSKDAEKLRAEIDDLLSKTTQDDDKARALLKSFEDTIAGWWDRITGWFE